MAKSKRHETEAPRAALELLFEETVSLYHQLTADAVKIHGGGPLSGPRRTVLVGLARSGPQTVAQMARVRAQSRQRFQPLVNGLLADGLVEARPNPSHRSSPLVALTPRGEQTVRAILERESSLRARFRIASSPATVRRAAILLREVRQALRAQLPELLAAIDRPSRK